MSTDPHRNTPAEEDRKMIPPLRDESAFQPIISVARSSNYHQDNQQLTETADDFREKNDSDCSADLLSAK